MSAYVLLNLLNELRKNDKMQVLPSNEFNKFNSTEARTLDSIYLMTLKLFENNIFGVKTSIFYHILCVVIMDVITLRY